MTEPQFLVCVFPELWGIWTDPKQVVETPVGQLCEQCQIPIASGDWGVSIPTGLTAGFRRAVVIHRGCYRGFIQPPVV